MSLVQRNDLVEQLAAAASHPALRDSILPGALDGGLHAPNLHGSANFTVVSDTYMTAVVPATGTTGYVTVTTPSGTLTSGKTFKVIPVIKSFTPTKWAGRHAGHDHRIGFHWCNEGHFRRGQGDQLHGRFWNEDHRHSTSRSQDRKDCGHHAGRDCHECHRFHRNTVRRAPSLSSRRA